MKMKRDGLEVRCKEWNYIIKEAREEIDIERVVGDVRKIIYTPCNENSVVELISEVTYLECFIF